MTIEETTLKESGSLTMQDLYDSMDLIDARYLAKIKADDANIMVVQKYIRENIPKEKRGDPAVSLLISCALGLVLSPFMADQLVARIAELVDGK